MSHHPFDPPTPIPEYLWPQRSVPLGQEDLRIAPSTDELRVIARALDVEHLAGHTLVTMREGSPWLEFDVVVPALERARDADEETRSSGLYRYAMWRYSGSVFRVGADGAVDDDPIDLGQWR
jgi:hypothetical protein